MADFRKEAPGVAFSASDGALTPSAANVDITGLAQQAIRFEEDYSLGKISEQFNKFSEDLPGALNASDQKELDSIKGSLDKEHARLKQKRGRPLQRRTAISSKANELIRENPRFASQISRMAKGLSPSAATGEKTLLEKELEKAQVQAMKEGVSTEVVFKRMGLLKRQEDLNAISKASASLRSASQDEIFDNIRAGMELQQQNMLISINQQAAQGSVDKTQVKASVGQAVEGMINEWRSQTLELTGRYPSSQDTDAKREEISGGFSWVNELAESKDAVGIAQRAKQFASDNHWLDINKTYPDIIRLVSVFGVEKGFEAAELLAKATSSAQREALRATNPLIAMLTGDEFKSIGFNAGNRVYGNQSSSSRRSTPKEHQSVEDTMTLKLRKQEIEGQTDKNVRKAVHNSWIAEGKPVQMLSAYGSKEAYQKSITNDKESRWFKDEWSRQSKANVDILRRAASKNVHFELKDGKIDYKVKDLGKQKVGASSSGFGLGGALTPDPEIANAVRNLNRLGGYLGNGWGSLFAETGLTSENVLESFVDTANLDPGIADSVLKLENLDNEDKKGELLGVVDNLLKDNPDASAKDLVELLKSKKDNN